MKRQPKTHYLTKEQIQGLGLKLQARLDWQVKRAKDLGRIGSTASISDYRRAAPMTSRVMQDLDGAMEQIIEGKRFNEMFAGTELAYGI